MTTRGIRNHNPGNIRANGDPWQGLADPASDGEYCRFENPAWGIRAIARTLITYQDKHGLRTVRGIIARWAPPSENDTEAYIRHVVAKIGVGETQRLNVHDHSDMRSLVEAIILHENGVQPYSDAQIDKGLLLAGVEPPQKPLTQSRTVQGGQAVSLGTVGVALSEAASQLSPLAEYSNILKWAFLGLTIAGVAVMLWARIDDRNKGLR